MARKRIKKKKSVDEELDYVIEESLKDFMEQDDIRELMEQKRESGKEKIWKKLKKYVATYL